MRTNKARRSRRGMDRKDITRNVFCGRGLCSGSVHQDQGSRCSIHKSDGDILICKHREVEVQNTVVSLRVRENWYQPTQILVPSLCTVISKSPFFFHRIKTLNCSEGLLWLFPVSCQHSYICSHESLHSGMNLVQNFFTLRDRHWMTLRTQLYQSSLESIRAGIDWLWHFQSVSFHGPSMAHINYKYRLNKERPGFVKDSGMDEIRIIGMRKVCFEVGLSLNNWKDLRKGKKFCKRFCKRYDFRFDYNNCH